MHASGHSLQQTTCMSLHQNNTTCTILVMTSSHCLTLMTCSLGSRLQSAKVRRSPSRNFLLETVTSSLELWSISSGRGLIRYLSRRWNSLSRFFSWSDGSEPQKRDVFPLVYYLICQNIYSSAVFQCNFEVLVLFFYVTLYIFFTSFQREMLCILLHCSCRSL